VRPGEFELLKKLDATCKLFIFISRVVVLPNETFIAFQAHDKHEYDDEQSTLRLFAWPHADAYCTLIDFFSLCFRAERLNTEQIHQVLALPDSVRLNELGEAVKWRSMTAIGGVQLARCLEKDAVVQYSWARYDARGPLPAHLTAEFYASGKVTYYKGESRIAATFQERQFVAEMRDNDDELKEWDKVIEHRRASMNKKK
jgi:hypothetical protein